MPAVNNESLTLDLTKTGGLMQALYLGQGDKVGTKITVRITDNGEVPAGISGMTPSFEMMLPDGAHYYSKDGTLAVTDEGAVATITIDETKAASIPGITDVAYIQLKQGTSVIASTERFRVVCLKNAADGATPATSWTSGIEQAVKRANDAAIAAEGIVLQAVPTMSATVKGGAKVGTGLEMSGSNSDVLQVAKALRDSISQKTGTVAKDTNWNDCTNMGMYIVKVGWANLKEENNAPVGCESGYGILYVLDYTTYTVQVFYSVGPTGQWIWVRMRDNSTWKPWVQVV